MTKFWKFLALIIALILLIWLILQLDFYPKTGEIFKVDYRENLVYIVDETGNIWTFYGAENWRRGDVCSLIMSGHFTETVFDDSIVKVEKSGYNHDKLHK